MGKSKKIPKSSMWNCCMGGTNENKEGEKLLTAEEAKALENKMGNNPFEERKKEIDVMGMPTKDELPTKVLNPLDKETGDNKNVPDESENCVDKYFCCTATQR